MTRVLTPVECPNLVPCGVEEGVPSCSSTKVETLISRGMYSSFIDDMVTIVMTIKVVI